MGMMTRRNVKQRAVKKAVLSNTNSVEEKEDLSTLPFVDVPNTTSYTKTDINRMSTADLKELASANGLDGEMTGAELKKALIDYYNL